MENNESQKENPPEILAVEGLLMALAQTTEVEEKRFELIDEIDATLESANAKGYDTTFHRNKMEEIMDAFDEKEYPDVVKILRDPAMKRGFELEEVQREIRKKIGN